MSKVKIVLTALVVFFGVSVLLGSWYTVNQGYRGVIVRNGAVVGTAEPGLSFKVPLIDTVYDISIQEQARDYAPDFAWGDAEATAIKARADALKDNAGLIELTKAERWNGQLPSTMVPNSTVPFLNMNENTSPSPKIATVE